jgi:hypothetical protein
MQLTHGNDTADGSPSLITKSNEEIVHAQDKRDGSEKQSERQLDHVPTNSTLRFQQEMQAMIPREVKGIVRQMVREVLAEDMQSKHVGREWIRLRKVGFDPTNMSGFETMPVLFVRISW